MADASLVTPVTVVVPAYNEAAAVRGTIDRLRQALAWAPDSEILVVDDGSADGTGDAAAASGARVLRHPHNLGYGRALKTGIEAARHDAIVITDADGTYPVEQVEQLVRRLHEGFDMVVGARTGVNYAERGLKRLLRPILTFLVEFTTGRTVPDVNSGFRAFRRSTAMPYFGQLCDTFSFTTSLTLAYMMTGRFVAYVTVGYDARIGATKVRLLRDALRTLQYMVQSIVYYNPIKMFLLLAVACVLVSACAAAAALLGAGGMWPVTIVGLLCAIAVFAMGLVADLLRQILAK